MQVAAVRTVANEAGIVAVAPEAQRITIIPVLVVRQVPPLRFAPEVAVIMPVPVSVLFVVTMSGKVPGLAVSAVIFASIVAKTIPALVMIPPVSKSLAMLTPVVMGASVVVAPAVMIAAIMTVFGNPLAGVFGVRGLHRKAEPD